MIRLIAVLATTIPLFSPIILRSNIFCDVHFFPMLIDNEYTINFTYLLTPGETAKITITHEYARRKETVYSQSIISTGEYKSEFTFEAKIDSRITMKAETVNRGTALHNFNVTARSKLPRIDLNESSVFDNPGAYIQINENGKLNTYDEKASFINFNVNYELPSSLYFDISELGFTYESNYMMPATADAIGLLGIIDNNNLFPKIKYSDYYKARVFAIDFVEDEDGHVKLKFKNRLFVDKTTRMMSTVQEEGYIETTKLFFPVNRHEEIDGLEFFIEIIHFGILHLDVDFEGVFRPKKRIIGDCLTSSYCVTSQETELDDSDVISEVHTRD